MSILGYIHTFNDEDVVGRSIRALQDQTLALDEILVVDNGSTDGTLAVLESSPVTILRHSENLGTSGSVVAGFEYALSNGFEWIWLFDADSAPRPDALEILIAFYRNSPCEQREKVWLLSSLHVESGNRQPHYQALFSDRGFKNIEPASGEMIRAFDSTIWSGSLYKLEAVRAIGLPSLDYVLDWGEHEYGYRGKRRGYLAFLHQQSIVEHNIRDDGPALSVETYRLGPIEFKMRELPPIRCYYLVRNMLYFWLYQYHTRNVHTLTVCFLRVAKLTSSFVLRIGSHGAQVSACLRGIRDGISKRIERRY